MVDIVVNIDVDVTHDRFDLTGNNNDETFNNRPMLEGNPGHPKDFNFISWRNHRLSDCRKIAEYLKSQGEDISWFTNILNGSQDPWEKMVSPEYDPNQQIKRINKENFL
jgi:hypothetical protein